MLAVPAVHDAGDTFVMVTGSTSVRDVVWLTTAGLLPRMVAKMLSVAVFDLEKSADVATGAVYVVLRPVGMLTPKDDVQKAVAFSAPFVIFACKEAVDPFASSTLGLGVSTLIVSKSRSIVTV